MKLLATSGGWRMGSGDKSLLPPCDGYVLDQVLSRFGPGIEALALSANGNPARFARFGLPVLADTVEGFALQPAGQPIDPFFNINVPNDLAQAARLLHSMTP